MPPRPAFRYDSVRTHRPGLHSQAPSRGLAVFLVGIALLTLPASGWAAETARGLREKQMIRTERLGVLRPGGLVYAGDSDHFIVLPAAVAGAGATDTVEMMDSFYHPVASIALPVALSNPRAVAYDRRGERLLVLDVASRSLHVIPGGAAGTFATDRVARLEAPRVGPLRPVGMTVDPESGEVFVLDRLLRRIVRFTPAPADAAPEAIAAVPDAGWIHLGPLASTDLSGLAFDPVSRHLFTLAPERRRLYELGLDGKEVASYDVSAIRLSDPQSMVFAPSGDPTDDPTMQSLFVADPGTPGSRRGHVIEMAWTTATAPALEDASIQATIVATVVRTTKTSLYSPPSPDPSGVCYNSVTGRLIITDAEVEEMNIYAGKNEFETSLAGALVRSWTTLPWDIEPTGTAFNPTTRQLYVTNDDADRLWIVNPGADNLYGTNDDTRTSFKTNDFGCGDPEGVSYDPTGNRLFIADGVGEEIWVIRAGPNGVFNGAGSDDIITHFDTGQLGAVDPETCEWRNDTGTLLVLASTGAEIIREVTTTGSLINNIDVSAAVLSKPAGLAYAPSSGGGGMSVYIVNRAVDNDSNSSENDGTMVELRISTSVSNTAPIVSAGPDRTITLPSSASLDGTVTDDGLPTPTTLTTTWSKVSGPGTVTFTNANAIDTQASFSIAGTYVLRLTASDGSLSASDEMQAVAQPSGGGNVAPIVSAGQDLTVTLPAQASLNGTVTDDGLPSPPTLTSTWSKVSGPGTVTFQNANAVDTQAGFSAAGTYVLQLAASDGALSNSDQVQVIVQSAAGSGTDFRVASSSDDAEENSGGSVYLNSSDLELVFDTVNQTTGMRFTNVTIPRGAVINTAWVQFQADEVQSEVTSLTIQGQAADNAATFGSPNFDVSSRPRTTAAVAWTPPAWNTTGEAGPNQRTSELKTVIQQIVDRTGWASGNALVLLVTGTGHRTAEAWDGNAAAAPLLHVEVATGPANEAPIVSAGPDRTVTLPNQASLDGTVTDDGLPSPPTLTTTWSVVSGPGTVTFANANAVDTQASFSTAGTYVLRLAGNDGQLITEDQMQVVASSPAGNVAPIVSAGPDRTITLPAQAALDGTVTDDALPSPPTLTTTWSKVSGPGTVTFQNANAVDTQASFSIAGVYVLQLTASDGALSGSDQMQVTAQAANAAPVVSAGPDLEVILPAQAALNGTVTDDGQPAPANLTTTWSKVSGPGTVTFANGNAVDTQAAFSTAGTYVLRLTASDGVLTTTDQAQIVVFPPGTVVRRIAAGADDAEEGGSGSVNLASNDLDLGIGGSTQVAGFRFTSLAIPQGATIVSAAIQFQADERQSEVTNLLIQADSTGNAAAFVRTTANISGRRRTAASVGWVPAAWSTVGEAGASQRTPDLTAIIQEIVNRSDWVSGNSIVIIITGTGHRTAESFEGLSTGAARLELQFQ